MKNIGNERKALKLQCRKFFNNANWKLYTDRFKSKYNSLNESLYTKNTIRKALVTSAGVFIIRKMRQDKSRGSLKVSSLWKRQQTSLKNGTYYKQNL